MAKLRIEDVAKHCGLSTATVDRVLNGRPGASLKSKERVGRAVQELGFGELPPSLALHAKPKLRLKFILPLIRTSFSKKTLAAVREAPAAVEDVRVCIEVVHVDLERPEEVVRALDEVNPAQHQGVALFASDVPCVARAIERFVARGGKLVSIVTDNQASPRHHFAGIDNHAAGRVAGNLMGRFLAGRTGKVGIVLGSLNMRDQHDRYVSFTEVLRTRFPRLQPLPVSEGHSDAVENRRLVQRMMRRHDDLIGLYSAAAGNIGVLDAVAAEPPERRPVLIAHDLSDPLAKGLREGLVDAVISQDTGHIARSAVRVLKALCLDLPINQAQEQIGIDIYLADNLP